MTLRLTLARLLAALAVLGLLAAPLATPASAMTMPGTVHALAIASDSSGQLHSEMAMPEEMPCCPDKAPISDCSKDCPLMTLCLGMVLNLPTGAALLLPVGYTGLVFPQSDTALTSLGYGPPPRPPRT